MSSTCTTTLSNIKGQVTQKNDMRQKV